MEVVLAVVGGVSAWCAVWVMLGGAGMDARRLLVRTQAFAHAARRGLGRLATTDAVGALLASEDARDVADELVRRLARAHVELSREEACAIALLGAPSSVVLGGLASRSVLGALMVLLGIGGFYRLWPAARRRRLLRERAQEMPGVLRTMATALESGHTLVQAIEYVGTHERGQAAVPFARASLRLRCGMSIDAALDTLRQELRAPGVDLMVTALSISRRTGSPLRSLLQRSAALVEQREEFERALAVKTAQVRLSVRVVCGLPALMVCLLAMISPDFQEGIASGPGMVCLLLAATLDALALLLIRRIMEGVL